MLEYKGQAVLLLARINERIELLKQCEDTQEESLPSVVSELVPEMVCWCCDIYSYWKEHKDTLLAMEIEKVQGIEFLQAHLNELSETLIIKQYYQLSKFIKMFNLLKSGCKKYFNKKAKETRGNLKLTTELNELCAKPLMLQATRAGFLDSQYQPLAKLSMIQIKALAFALGKSLNIPERKRWALFERHWNLPHLKSTPMPFGITKELEAIIEFYSDIDFTELLGTKRECRFLTPYSARRIKTMFHKLIELGYVDPDTTELQMLGIFRYDKMAKPINWLKGLRALAYFVYNTFGRTNKDIWIATGCCFTINYERINRASLKTALTTIKSKDKMSCYAPAIISIAEQFNRPIRKQMITLSDDSLC